MNAFAENYKCFLKHSGSEDVCGGEVRHPAWRTGRRRSSAVTCAQPILTNEDLAKIRSVEVALDGAFRTATIDTTWDASTGADGLAMAIKEIEIEQKWLAAICSASLGKSR